MFADVVLGAGKHQHVVHDRAVARLDLDGADPLVFLEAGIDLEILIAHLALGRHAEWLFRNRRDEIGFARQLPAGHARFAARASPWGRLRERRLGPRRRSTPFHRLAIRGCFRTCRTLAGVPRRHAALAHDLLDHRRPADDLLVIREREGRDFAVAMTLDAAILQDASDLVRIRHRRILSAASEFGRCGSRPVGSPAS